MGEEKENKHTQNILEMKNQEHVCRVFQMVKS
jgi:hypothetical protein